MLHERGIYRRPSLQPSQKLADLPSKTPDRNLLKTKTGLNTIPRKLQHTVAEEVRPTGGFYTHKHCPRHVSCEVYRSFSGPSDPHKSQHHEHHGPVWVPNFLVDATQMRFQHPCKTLGMFRCPKMKIEGPIVLMMLAQKVCPKTSVA